LAIRHPFGDVDCDRSAATAAATGGAVPGTGHRLVIAPQPVVGFEPVVRSRLPFVALPLTQSRYVATNIL
jgi:hypothetical protein